MGKNDRDLLLWDPPSQDPHKPDSPNQPAFCELRKWPLKSGFHAFVIPFPEPPPVHKNGTPGPRTAKKLQGFGFPFCLCFFSFKLVVSTHLQKKTIEHGNLPQIRDETLKKMSNHHHTFWNVHLKNIDHIHLFPMPYDFSTPKKNTPRPRPCDWHKPSGDAKVRKFR